ncbi:MAG: preprotein translocase subunit SecG [Rikenellaceae bacterium]
MLYTICIGLILVACVLVILAILVQSPKSGMAANFGASNQVMGVRQTSDFLEKFTWTMAIAILALSLLATVVMDGSLVSRSNSELSRDAESLIQTQSEVAPAIPQAELPLPEEAPAAE